MDQLKEEKATLERRLDAAKDDSAKMERRLEAALGDRDDMASRFAELQAKHDDVARSAEKISREYEAKLRQLEQSKEDGHDEHHRALETKHSDEIAKIRADYDAKMKEMQEKFQSEKERLELTLDATKEECHRWETEKETTAAALAVLKRKAADHREVTLSDAETAKQEALVARQEVDELRMEILKRRRDFDAQTAELRHAQDKEARVAHQVAVQEKELERLRRDVAISCPTADLVAQQGQQSMEVAGLQKSLDIAQKKIVELTEARFALERSTADGHFEAKREVQDLQVAKQAALLKAEDAMKRLKAAEEDAETVRNASLAKDSKLSDLAREVATLKRQIDLASLPIEAEKVQIQRRYQALQAEADTAKQALEHLQATSRAEKDAVAAEAAAQLKRVACDAAKAAEDEWAHRLKAALADATNDARTHETAAHQAQNEITALQQTLADVELKAQHRLAAERQAAETARDELNVLAHDHAQLKTELDRIRHLLAKEYEEADLRRAYEFDAILKAATSSNNNNTMNVVRSSSSSSPPPQQQPTVVVVNALQERLDAVKAEAQMQVDALLPASSPAPRKLLAEFAREDDDDDLPTTTAALNVLVTSAHKSRPRIRGDDDIIPLSRGGVFHEDPSSSPKVEGPGFKQGYWHRIYGDDIEDHGPAAVYFPPPSSSSRYRNSFLTPTRRRSLFAGVPYTS